MLRLAPALFLALTIGASLASAQVVSIYDIQYTTDPSGDSPYDGQVVSCEGVVTAVHYDGFVIYAGAGPWQAVFVYDFTVGPAIGDGIVLTGTVQEFYGMTEITDLQAWEITSHDNPVLPLVVPSAEVSQEQYESVLITVTEPTVTALLTYGEWTLDGTLVCDDLNDYLYFPRLDDTLDSITGTLFYSFGAFKLEPRDTGDIAGDVIAHYALGGDLVTMNEAREILIDHWVEVLGDRIVAIHSAAPTGLPAVDTDALIFPGLIDAHNHPAYNVLGPIPFTQLYEHRDEWRNDPLYDEFTAQYQAILANPDADLQRTNIYKLAEVRAMASGTTTIQGPNSYGHGYDEYAHQGIGINNAHRWPPRIFHSTFPLWDSASDWQQRASENWRRFVVHVAEGTNQTARDEFAQWQALVPLDERTTIIHGTALQAPEWSAMAAAGSHLVWSPQSNIALYGTTTDVPGALAAGVNVALAPDWTESGSNDVLAEMKAARDWSDSEWGGLLTAELLTEMVTVNAAEALGMSDLRGRLAPGLRADLMVIAGDPAQPYQALLAAEPADVELTVISGRPGYGDPALMDQFPWLSLTEDLTIADQPKRLALAVESHAIDLTDMPFSEVLAMLESAYETATPELCCFRGLEVSDCDLTDVPEFGPSLVELQAHPNPFNPQLTVTFTLQRPEPVTAAVYGLDGRQVAEIARGRFTAGAHVLRWDGRGRQGQAMPSGVYLVRMAAGTTTLSEKVALVR